MNRPKAVMNWSGGKDSALALYHCLQAAQWNVASLLTTVNAEHDRVSMHGVRAELLAAQADRLQLPLRTIRLSGNVSMETYNARLFETMQDLRRQGITRSIFGDIFLADLRAYRESQLLRADLTGVFPLWQRDSVELVHEFVDLGFRAVLVCVNEKRLGAEFVGRELDLDLLKDLPKTVNACGENGEYHSFVYDGPIFTHPISLVRGETVRRTFSSSADTDQHTTDPDQNWDLGFWYQDLLLSE